MTAVAAAPLRSSAAPLVVLVIAGCAIAAVTNGIRTMAGYGHQIPAPEDRWAVVAYVKALQLSQHAPAGMVPPELREQVPVVPTLIGGQPLLPTTQPTTGATQPAANP